MFIKYETHFISKQYDTFLLYKGVIKVCTQRHFDVHTTSSQRYEVFYDTDAHFLMALVISSQYGFYEVNHFLDYNICHWLICEKT